METKSDARRVTDKAIDGRATSDRLAQQRPGESEETRTRFGRTSASRQPPTERRRRQAGFPVRVPTACGSQSLIEAPLRVYVMWGSPVTGSAVRDEVAGAGNIWEQGAGIRFIPVYREIDEATTRWVLRTQAESARGLPGGLEVLPPGASGQRLFQSEHWTALGRFHREQSGGVGIAVVFAQAPGMSEGRAEPSLRLVVISRPHPLGDRDEVCPTGRLLAHEIGHVFLGRGHPTSGQVRPEIRSPLMFPAGRCEIGIEASDCRRAHNKARQIPGVYMFGDSPTGVR